MIYMVYVVSAVVVVVVVVSVVVFVVGFVVILVVDVGSVLQIWGKDNFYENKQFAISYETQWFWWFYRFDSKLVYRSCL